MFAYVERGALVRFLPSLPPTFKDVRGVGALSESEQIALGLFPVTDLTPAFDPLVIRLSNLAPTVTMLADRVEITRQTEPIPPAEVAEYAAREALLTDPVAVDIRNRLRTATPAGINTYVDAQVTDLASARTMLKRILLILALLSR